MYNHWLLCMYCFSFRISFNNKWESFRTNGFVWTYMTLLKKKQKEGRNNLCHFLIAFAMLLFIAEGNYSIHLLCNIIALPMKETWQFKYSFVNCSFVNILQSLYSINQSQKSPCFIWGHVRVSTLTHANTYGSTPKASDLFVKPIIDCFF